MKLEDYKIWLKTARYVDNMYYDHNSSSDNVWEGRVFEKDGELFVVEYLNGEPVERIEHYVVEPKKVDSYTWDDGTRIRRFPDEVNEPKKVIRKTRIVEEVYYEKVK